MAGNYPGTIGIYRCVTTGNNMHFISTSSNCEGTKSEGMYGYIYTSQANGYLTPLYRFSNPSNNDHLETVNYNDGACYYNFGYGCVSLHYESILGYVYTPNNYPPCASCPTGQYTSVACSYTANAQCVGCPAGQYQPNAGQGSCYLCPCGQYNPYSTQAGCYGCLSGMYSGTGWGGCNGCDSCPAGQYVTAWCTSCGDITCAYCPAGQYQPYSQYTYCFACPAGQYQTSSGAIGCNGCPAG